MSTAKARQKKFGDIARVLGQRLDDLSALESLDQASFIPGRFEQLTGEYSGQYSMRLSGNMRLIITPVGGPMPLKNDGTIDLTRITTIKISDVIDYH
jgi:proteic killer suppression protein